MTSLLARTSAADIADTVVIPQVVVDVPRLQKFRPDLQGLRAVAIIMVVFLHVGLINIHGGVDLSFVISGFLVGGILLRQIDSTGRVAFGKFWASRFRRLAPGMMVVIVSTIAFAWIFASPLKFRGYVVDALYSTFSSLNWRLAVQGTDYFAHASQTPFQHFWSLGIEEQFYVIFPILLLGVGWLSRKIFGSRVLVGAMLAVIIGASFYLSVTVTNTAQPWAYFGFHTRAWELALGVLLALTAEVLSRMPRGFAAVLTWVGLATIIVTGMLITDSTPLPGYAIAGPVLGAAMIIAGGCANPTGGVEWVLKRGFFNLVGKVSYGWYLWHWPILILWPDVKGADLSFGDRLRVVGLSFFLACAMYYLVERLIRGNELWVKIPRRGIALGASLLATTTAVLAIAIYVPLNLPPVSASAAQANAALGSNFVQDSVTVQTLPGNLQPSLVDAPHDKARHGCIADIPTTTVRITSNCIIGDTTSTKTLVLFGDSHAWQWGDTFDLMGKQLGLRVVTITKSGCSPEVYHIMNPQLNRDYTECDEWRTAAVSTIAAMRPYMVVLAGRVRTETTKAGAEAIFDQLRAIGSKLVYLTDSPHPGIDIPDCLAQHATHVTACNRSVSDAVEFPDFRDMERAVAVSYGASVVDVLPVFCTDRTCPPVIGGRVVYFDDSHITSSYAVALAPFMVAAFTALVQ